MMPLHETKNNFLIAKFFASSPLQEGEIYVEELEWMSTLLTTMYFHYVW